MPSGIRSLLVKPLLLDECGSGWSVSKPQGRAFGSVFVVLVASRSEALSQCCLQESEIMGFESGCAVCGSSCESGVRNSLGCSRTKDGPRSQIQ